MSKVKLELSLNAFEMLHELVDNKKKNVKVDRKTLLMLLCDHSSLISACEDAGVTVIDDIHTYSKEHVSTSSDRPKKAKQWKVISPDGVEEIVDNLTAFCKANGLTGSVMSGVANGKYSHHKQWKCEKIA